MGDRPCYGMLSSIHPICAINPEWNLTHLEEMYPSCLTETSVFRQKGQRPWRDHRDPLNFQIGSALLHVGVCSRDGGRREMVAEDFNSVNVLGFTKLFKLEASGCCYVQDLMVQCPSIVRAIYHDAHSAQRIILLKQHC